jgi:hypothetical protein
LHMKVLMVKLKNPTFWKLFFLSSHPTSSFWFWGYKCMFYPLTHSPIGDCGWLSVTTDLTTSMWQREYIWLIESAKFYAIIYPPGSDKQYLPDKQRISAVPVAARSKTWVCGRSPAEIVCLNPTGGIDVCLLCAVM